MKKFVKIKILTIAVMLSIFGCADTDEVVLYSRSDCIVKVTISWDVHGVERVKAMNTLMDLILDYQEAGHSEELLSGLAFQKNGSEVYLQYGSDCEQRANNARDLFSGPVHEFLDGKAYVHITEEKVEPGVDTISLEGERWID